MARWARYFASMALRGRIDHPELDHTTLLADAVIAVETFHAILTT